MGIYRKPIWSLIQKRRVDLGKQLAHRVVIVLPSRTAQASMGGSSCLEDDGSVETRDCADLCPVSAYWSRQKEVNRGAGFPSCEHQSRVANKSGCVMCNKLTCVRVSDLCGPQPEW
eukprot:SAG11_NODE_808_length_7088_cov_5.136357_7_plen_116_part_00